MVLQDETSWRPAGWHVPLATNSLLKTRAARTGRCTPKCSGLPLSTPWSGPSCPCTLPRRCYCHSLVVLRCRLTSGSSAAYLYQQTAEDLVRCVEIDKVWVLYTGTNVSVCVALAVLLCCFLAPQKDGKCRFETPFQQIRAPQHSEEREHQIFTGAERSAAAALGSSAADQRRLSTQEGEPGCASACCSETKGTRVINSRNQMYREAARSDNPEIDRLSKSQLRQRLAFLSAYYPVSCPSRGNLRQVFNFASCYRWSLRSR